MPARPIKLMLLITALAITSVAPADAAERKHPKHKKVATENSTQRCRGNSQFPCGPLYYNGGEYLGDDPDPNIRFQIWRDLGAHFGSGD